jgi:hypothetical protein
MIRHLRPVPACFLLSVFIVGFTLSPMAEAFDKDPPAAYDKSDGGQAAQHDIVQGPHVEGHIAFLHAELGITPEQEPLWAPVAAAMREDVREMQDAENRVGQQNPDAGTAVRYLENMAVFSHLRAKGEDRFLAALRPLYDHFSRAQKQAADELFMQHRPD